MKKGALLRSFNVARGGLEPPHTVPKTAVLPLDDQAISSSIDIKTFNLNAQRYGIAKH
jgi:hypothetical protein